MNWDDDNIFTQSALMHTWQDRMLYIGHLSSDSRSYSNSVCLFGLSLNSKFTVSSGGKKIITSSFLLLPDTLHKIDYDPQDVVVWILIEPSHFHCEQIKKMMSHKHHHCFFDINNLEFIKNIFLSIYYEKPEPTEVCKRVSTAFNLSSHTYDDHHVKDMRISTIMNKINSNLSHSISSTDLAKEVGLSSSRLQQLFKEKAQMSIRKYRLWQRLKHACELSIQGNSLSDAALLSGFYDAAHFSKAFRDNFGKKASSLIGSSTGVSAVNEF